MERKVFDISWLTLWRVLFFVAFAVLLFQGLSILLGLFLSIVISSGLEFVVNFLERLGVPRTLGVVLIFLATVMFVIIIVYAIIPVLIVDVSNAFSGIGKSNAWWAPLVSPRATQSVTTLLNRVSTQIFSQDGSIGAISSFFGGIALAISIVISSFYLSLTRDGVERFIRAVFPFAYEDPALKIYERAKRKIGFWFRSQILLSITMFLLVWGALTMLSLKHAFLLGILAGVFELVPFVGPILSGAAAFLSALSISTPLAVYTLIVFVILHQIESHFLVPILIGRNVGLHPVLVIIALLIGAEMGGLLGILISVPAAVVIQEVVEEWSATRKRPRSAEYTA